MNKREQLISEIALSVATGSSDEEICDKQDITLTRLKRIKKRQDFEDFLKAYHHNLQSGISVEILTHAHARATYLLSGLTPNKRPRTGVLELLDLVLNGWDDPDVFLLKYEQRHGVKWEDLP